MWCVDLDLLGSLSADLNEAAHNLKLTFCNSLAVRVIRLEARCHEGFRSQMGDVHLPYVQLPASRP